MTRSSGGAAGSSIRREVDLVAAWSVDRLGRSLQDLVGFLTELHASGVDLYLHRQGLDTSTPAGRALFQMLEVFAEFERALIIERTRAGLARARVQGKALGRPKVAAEIEAAVRARLAEGTGVQKTARLCGCGVGTVQRRTFINRLRTAMREHVWYLRSLDEKPIRRMPKRIALGGD